MKKASLENGGFWMRSIFAVPAGFFIAFPAFAHGVNSDK